MGKRNTRRGYTQGCFLLTQWSKGFTLIEILVVVLIIGILGAIALPQYQRAVLKSRVAALMPIAKSLADSNEVYYLDNGEYADNAQDLPIQGRMNYPDGTTLEFGTSTAHAYVLATRGEDFPNHYIVYQKHSEQFPGEIHCEADSTNDMAQEVCKSFGATDGIGEILTEGFTTYVLSGTGRGVAPSRCPSGATCDENGNITECPNGQTLKNGSCGACDIENATQCSTTEYKATACSTGYTPKNGTCEQVPTCGGNPQPAAQTESCGNGYTSGTRTQEAECLGGSWHYLNKWDWSGCTADSNAVQTFLASSDCTGNNHCFVNGDGTISRCTGQSTYDAENHKCMPSYQPNKGFVYAYLYNADGKELETHSCVSTSTSGSECYRRYTYTYDPATGNKVSYKGRECQTDVVMDENWNCANGGTYSYGYDYSYSPTTGKQITEYRCGNNDCSTYIGMMEWNDTRTQYRTCKTLSTTSGACDEWNAWGAWNYY